jgi:general secretion pathway protein B
MSLILEALKKSEAERQRVAGPTLLEMRIAKPQRRYPIWAVAVGVLLLSNMVLLLVFVLRKPAPASVAAPVIGVQVPPPALSAAPAPAGRLITTVPSATTAPATPDSAAPVVNTPDLAPPPQVAGASAHAAAPTLADDAGAEPTNPADELPAVSPGAGSVKFQRDDSGGYANLPSFTELSNNMPPLRLDLHVYAEHPGDRYALINMERVHEGDTLSEGMKVLAITREGVALDYRGQQFMLHPQ